GGAIDSSHHVPRFVAVQGLGRARMPEVQSVSAGQPELQASQESYVVQHGDTLSRIAAQQGVSLAQLEAANPQIHNPNVIYPGQHITIPGHGGGGGGASSSAPVDNAGS